MFRSLCPTVFDLYDKISAHPVKQEDVTSSLLYLYENFLMDLKVNLLGVDATLSLVDCIEMLSTSFMLMSIKRMCSSRI